MIVAVHRGPCWAGPLARRLHAAGCPAGLPWPAGGWHVYELAPLETAIAQRLAGQVLAAGGWSALRPYAGASALLVGGNPLRLAELADRWCREPDLQAAGRAMRTALLATLWVDRV